MERLDFETLFRIVRWDYNRCFKDESLDKDLFMGKYGKVMGENYYNKFVHEFNGNILKETRTIKNGISACLQGKLWTILMDCLISMNVPMEHYGTVAFLLRAMNVF